MLMRSLTAVSCVAAVLALNGCNNGDRREVDAATNRQPRAASRQAAPAATQPTSYTGTLRGGTVAIGGETTGWRLEGDGATGGMDVDVSKVRQRARVLDGRRVEITGRMTTKSWTERGEQQVLVAERIEEAPPKAPGAAR